MSMWRIAPCALRPRALSQFGPFRPRLDDLWAKRLEFWSLSTMPLSEVKARLSEVAEEVDRTHDCVHITRNGREYVVLISAEDLESLEATIELLSDPAAMARVRDAEAAAARGETVSAEEIALLMEQRRARERAE
jgi:antitoxin YefM